MNHVVPFIMAFSLTWGGAVRAESERLSQTGLYRNIEDKTLSPDVYPFSPQYPLWTDGAEKSRWIYLPPGGVIDNSDPDHWSFPVGTKFWKEFRFGKRVETRYLEKGTTGWLFATYLWNESETEATRAATEGVSDYYPTNFGTQHDIPSLSQCQRCHSRGGDPVLGFDPLQLSADRDAQAPHARQPEPGSLDLPALLTLNLLSSPTPAAPRIHAATSRGRTAMGYLHANCGHCHNPSGRAAGTQLFLRHTETAKNETEEPAFSTAVGKRTRSFQIPGQNRTYRILRSNPDQSAIPYRIEHGSMPQIGNDVVDEEALTLLRDWIEEL